MAEKKPKGKPRGKPETKLEVEPEIKPFAPAVTKTEVVVEVSGDAVRVTTDTSGVRIIRKTGA